MHKLVAALTDELAGQQAVEAPDVEGVIGHEHV